MRIVTRSKLVTLVAFVVLSLAFAQLPNTSAPAATFCNGPAAYPPDLPDCLDPVVEAAKAQQAAADAAATARAAAAKKQADDAAAAAAAAALQAQRDKEEQDAIAAIVDSRNSIDKIVVSNVVNKSLITLPIILTAAAIVAVAGFFTTLAIRRYRRRGSDPLPTFSEPDLETQMDFDRISSEIKSAEKAKAVRKATAEKAAVKTAAPKKGTTVRKAAPKKSTARKAP